MLFGKENIFLREPGLKCVMDTYEAKMKVKIIKANKIKSEWKVYKFR